MPSKIRPIVIAHRGASAYLPEHSLAAKALAHGFGADFLEQDVVATRDDQLVVLHDVHIDRVSNVQAVFAGRERSDGRFYARDFDLSELRTLSLTERCTAEGHPVYPQRYPAGPTPFTIPTLAEELAFIAGLNRSRQRNVGIYCEIKKPAWHRQEGIDLTAAVYQEIAGSAFGDRPDLVWLQCFDLNENKYLRDTLNSKYRLVQLLAEDAWQESPTDFGGLLTPGGLRELAGVVDAIGPWIQQLYRLEDNESIVASHILSEAEQLGLAAHPYTARADDLPPGFANLEGLIGWLSDHGVDGLFTDFPDRAVRFFDQLKLPPRP